MAEEHERRDLSRLLRPTSIAVVGGGAWCLQVIRQSLAMGFTGDIFRVHPTSDPVEGIDAAPKLSDLPYAPDAVFLGINRHATLEAVKDLSDMGAGGAVCFASGYSEARAEDAQSQDMQSALVAAAGDMPILGPNCYGFLNAVDGALLWPDQHGCQRVERGVAILTQSSNIAINMSMQKRALPVAFVITCGNMAQTLQAEIALSLLDDPRVSAIGLHVEGFGDPQIWHTLALKACAKGVPLIVLKVGASDQARNAAISHTASLAGSNAGADAFLKHLGIPRASDVPDFLATLMLLHCNGPLHFSALSSISCSGGEASLIADVAEPHEVHFPPLTETQKTALENVLGAMVALSNPLDYHTYVWGNAELMTQAWLPMAEEHIGLVLIILDYPHTDASAWHCATQAAIALRKESKRPVAVVSTLVELLPEDLCKTLLEAGVTPLHGMREALAAAEAASKITAPQVSPPISIGPEGMPEMMSEATAKQALSQYGLMSPKHTLTSLKDMGEAGRTLVEPLVLKAQGLAHKSDTGAVAVGLSREELAGKAREMPGDIFLIEEMVQGAICELLIGVTRDPAHGFVLTVGAGGVLTEIWQDSVSFLLPVTPGTVADHLKKLRIYPLMTGYRGASAADLPSILDAIMAIQAYVLDNADVVYEVEVNPLICTKDAAVAADALIARLTRTPKSGETNGPD